MFVGGEWFVHESFSVLTALVDGSADHTHYPVRSVGGKIYCLEKKLLRKYNKVIIVPYSRVLIIKRDVEEELFVTPRI